MIIIVNFLSSRWRHHRNIFLSCATFRFKRQYFIEFYLPPTYFFQKKLFLQKGPVLGNKDLAVGSEVEGIPNGFLRVSYEDAFYPLWVRAYQPETFSYKRLSPKLLRNGNFGFLANHILTTSSQRSYVVPYLK